MRKQKILKVKHAVSGFTLIELVMVMVMVAIISGRAAIFIKGPITQYMSVSHRAELTDLADTALYKLAGDIGGAVPNSIRVGNCAGATCLEFLPSKAGGRYRVALSSATGTENILTFGTANTAGKFDIIGPTITFASGDYVVIGTNASISYPDYDTTNALGVLRAYTGAASSVQSVQIAAPQISTAFGSVSHHFYVIDGAQQAVTYACENSGMSSDKKTGLGQLKRYWKYGFYTTQPTVPISVQAPVPPNATAVQSAMLIDKVSGCAISYNAALSLLDVRLSITSGGETVSLYQQIHVSNTP